ncbi:hypothetical protein E2C01_048553 [Portunus trituberculatus]|uniref:Uncharacterized protein n=1 Tax=Portunus trituberculatus TaxID=210409 RepID=A0A5B7G3E6_PORTR|nr:hypothetical protein [Portunus trituberculatus]
MIVVHNLFFFPQKADMSPLDFSPSAERASVLDFGLTYSLDGVVILGKAPSLVTRPFLLLNVFSPLMWACLLTITWSAGAALGLLEKVEASLSGGGDRHPLNYFTSVFKIFIYQSECSFSYYSGNEYEFFGDGLDVLMGSSSNINHVQMVERVNRRDNI